MANSCCSQSPHKLSMRVSQWWMSKLPLDERRELEALGRDHRRVVAVAEVDGGLRESAAAALLEFRAEKDGATGGGCPAVVGAHNFALLLKGFRYEALSTMT